MAKEKEKAQKGDPVAAMYEQLLDKWRETQERTKSAPVVIKTNQVPWGRTRQGAGRTRYYLHPAIPSALHSVTAFEMELAPGSHGGMHRHQCEALLFVLEGKGYSIINGVRYEWEEGDVVCVPVGTTHQHGNSDPQKPARLLAVTPLPVFQAMGQGEMEQVEDSPAWKG